MKVRDEADWTIQEQMFRDQGETGVVFRDFMVFWCETAETMVDQAVLTANREMPITQAFRLALPIAEQQFGNLQNIFVGQMLLAIGNYWVHGQEVVTSLTNIELKFYMEAVQLNHERLSEMAAQQGERQE